eukprot:2782827-Pleurochrysis_carterae.AAC.1
MARLVSEPLYGGVAWAAMSSNGRYIGSLPGKGLVPASVLHARQQLASRLVACIKKVVGEIMPADLAAGEVRKLAEAVLAADIKVDQAVRLLGVQQPDAGEVRAATYGG